VGPGKDQEERYGAKSDFIPKKLGSGLLKYSLARPLSLRTRLSPLNVGRDRQADIVLSRHPRSGKDNSHVNCCGRAIYTV
jgi:hypothetical protein